MSGMHAETLSGRQRACRAGREAVRQAKRLSGRAKMLSGRQRDCHADGLAVRHAGREAVRQAERLSGRQRDCPTGRACVQV
jgi:hypothetical protein